MTRPAENGGGSGTFLVWKSIDRAGIRVTSLYNRSLLVFYSSRSRLFNAIQSGDTRPILKDLNYLLNPEAIPSR
jgi:hypothetical protein